VLATTEPHKMPATIVGRCQRFDFRRGSMDVVAEHLLHVAKDEGVTLTEPAAQAMARQSEGSFRDALSLLDQASVLGGGTIDEAVVTSLIGAGRQDVQYSLADAVAVGDARGVFELVSRLVQEGQDLRFVTNEVLTHFRNLLVVRTAPGQADLLDVTDDEVERLNAQAVKFSGPELARVISLLLAAQTDMRWTTSPRLSLELALIRSTVPEADERPEALLSRVERLERIAGMSPTAGSGVPAPGSGSAPRSAASDSGVPAPGSGSAARSPAAAAPAPGSAAPQSPSADTPAPKTRKAPSRQESAVGAGAEADSAPPAGSTRPERSSVGGEASGAGRLGAPAPTASPATPVLGAGTSAVDVSMLRQNWSAVISHLRGQGKAVLPSFLEIATPAAFDGETLELVFPPDRKFGVTKVEEREGELREALRELFGVAPVIQCVVREPVAGLVEVEDDPPLSEEEALARLSAELGATPATEDGA
jgi:DNA polymerase III gamma/tau subunit